MKNLMIICLTLLIYSGTLKAQDKYFTRDGHIVFSSSTSVEDIKANNNKVTCVLDAKSGDVEFAVLMVAFEFKKALMEEHFNENYVESETYPKSKFKGRILNIKEVDFSKDGSFPVLVEGQLTIHGETRQVSAKGTLDIIKENIKINSEFHVSPEDYNIEIPGVVREKIAKELLITVDILLAPFNR
jgi:hypothetical protein